MTSIRPDTVSLSAWKLPFEAALARARAVGATRVDLMAIPSWRQLDPARFVGDPHGWACRIARALRRHGLEVSTINAAVPDPHQWGTPARRRTMLAQSEALAMVARALGARVVSLYPGYHHQGSIDLGPFIATCRAWVEIGRRHGVHLAPEIHWHTVAADPAAARVLLSAVPGLRLVFDPSHALVAGIPLELWWPLLPHVVHVHLRDAAPGRLEVPWGAGTLDPEALHAALLAAGYRGHIAAEVLPDDGEAALARLGFRASSCP